MLCIWRHHFSLWTSRALPQWDSAWDGSVLLRKEIWSDSSFPSLTSCLAASLSLLPQRESWVTQAAPANVAEVWAKGAEKVKFICHGAVRALAKEQPGSRVSWKGAQCGQPGPVQCVWGIQHLLLCAELLKCLLGKKEKCFVGVGAAKSRFVEFLLLVFQRTEEGWGLCACSAPCGWAPLAEQANTSVLWEHRKGSAQRISSL